MNQSLPKLRVITTGGTIGMVRDAEGFARPPQNADEFCATLGVLADRYTLDLLPLCNRDSSNMLPNDWHAITAQIMADETGPTDYVGTVVVHGTDTLAHGAATVALTLGPPPLARPVVFTGAMRTPDTADYDGMTNLEAACRVATSALGEVAVAFAGRVLRGCRCAKASATQLDAFASPGGGDLGRVVDGRVELADHAVRRGKSAAAAGWLTGLKLDANILSIALTPGLSPDGYRLILGPENACRGILLSTFGAGNLPDRAGYDWVGFVRDATRRGIAVLLTSPFAEGRTDHNDYALGRAAVEAGGIVVPDLTPACVEMKFRYALEQAGLSGDDPEAFVRRAMLTSWFGETGGLPHKAPRD